MKLRGNNDPLVESFTMSHSMSPPETVSRSPDIDKIPSIPSEFMSALQRLLKIGVYYPSGHSILDQASERFLTLLRSYPGNRHYVRLKDDGTSLLLEDAHLDPSLSFVEEFRGLMVSLSIISIEIDRSLSKEDLYNFIRRMIAWRSQGSNSKRFASIEIVDLPAKIHVRQKKFLAREEESLDSRLDSAARNLNTFLDALAGYGLTEDQIAYCRRVLASLPDRIKEMKFKFGQLPMATWDDIALLLADSVQGKPLSSRSSSHGNLDMLASILSSIEEETDDIKAREAINLLVSILRRPPVDRETETKDEVLPSVRSGRKFSQATASELQDFTDTNRLSSSSLQKIQDIPPEYETLSILMQLAEQRQSVPNQERMQNFFNDVFTVPPQEKTWDILAKGLLAIVRTGDRSSLAMAVRLITESLRRSDFTDPLELFTRTMKICRGTEKHILWPFAVNELLLSDDAGSETFHLLCFSLAGLSMKDMIQALPVLQSLAAFQQGQIGTGFFSQLTPQCYPLCAFLLKTSIAPQIEGQLLDGLRNTPADDLIKVVAPLINTSIPEHKTFIDQYLQHWTRKGERNGLKDMAGKIIVRRLALLPQEVREQPWVPGTIASMADLPGRGGRELLHQIVNGRRLILIPEWPASCRKAAEKTLEKLRQRSKPARKSF